MKKLVIEIKTVTDKSKKSDEIEKKEESFQSKLKKGIDKLSNPVGVVKDEAQKLAGAKGVAVVGAISMVAQQVLSQTIKSVNFAISGVGMTTGNSSLQENIAREQEKVLEIVNMAKGIVGGAATGAIMGAAFGPVGAAIGAVGGAVFGGVMAETDKQRKYEERRREYEFAAWKFDTARSVSSQRAGVVTSSGRLHQY